MTDPPGKFDDLLVFIEIQQQTYVLSIDLPFAKVDNCGIKCPSELPRENAATIMSYCNFCAGGLSNVALTLGGIWNGIGDKSDIANWSPNPNLSLSSVTPERVSHHVWNILAKKGEVITPFRGEINFDLCVQDSDCEDGDQCTVNICSDFVCASKTQEPCVGNGVCEAGESVMEGDCGPYTIGAVQSCSNCGSLGGFFFDVTSPVQILITSVKFHMNYIISVDSITQVDLFATKEGKSE